jgi:hypothetical protein
MIAVLQLARGNTMDDPRAAKDHAYESDLVDVTRQPLHELLVSKDPALVDAVKRLLREAVVPRETSAGWSNRVESHGRLS